MTSPLLEPALFHIGPVPIPASLCTSVGITVVLGAGSFILSRLLRPEPGKVQAMCEVVITTILEQIEEVTRKDGRPYLPLIGTLFLFLIVANSLSLIPGLQPPTERLETVIALSLTVFVSVYYYGIRRFPYSVNLNVNPLTFADIDTAQYSVPGTVPISPLVGVALRRWFPPRPRLVPHRLARRLGAPDPQAGPEGELLLDLLARTLDGLVAAHGAFIVFLPSYRVAHEADDTLCQGILERMRRPQGAVLRLDEPALYQACCGELAVLLGGRMHPMILAAAMGTPVVGLAYNPKFHGLMALLDQPEACLDVAGLVQGADPGPLLQRLHVALGQGRRPVLAPRRMVARLRAFDAELLAVLNP